MDNFQKDVIDRLARIEVNQENQTKKLEEHLKHHYDISIRSLFALVGAGLAILISLFK